jgi:sodium/potassium-transporting ATPase subunit alpha
MEPEKIDDHDEKEGLEESAAAQVADQRIQFVPGLRPDHRRDDDAIQAASRRQSIASIPPVLSEKERTRREREKEEEKKNVNIDEHLLPHQDVADRYKTRINMDKPGDSQGLTSQQAEALVQEHGLNVLTPPKKRHPFLKYLDYLTSLFNLLLIVAGVLEYILLGIDFKDNFQNVRNSSCLLGWRIAAAS